MGRKLTPMSDFRPPIDNPAFMALCKWGLPLETVCRSHVEVKVQGDGLERFRSLKNEHVVVVANHSDQLDPEAMFIFSKIVGEDFYFIAAREVFDWIMGLTGLFFQNLGVYSVLRGRADFESFTTTRNIIAVGRRKLVVFPEGEVTGQPDSILPLRKGATRLFFEGQEELLRRSADKSVIVQPIGIRWLYKRDITGALDKQLRKIEERLGLRVQATRDLCQLEERLHAAAAAMLSALEDEYRLPHREELPYEDRVIVLRSELLKRLAALTDIHLPPERSHLDWLRRVTNFVRESILNDVSHRSPFQRRLHHEQVKKMWRFVQDIHRIQHFIGIREPQVSRPATQERLAVRASRIEREVLGYVSDKGTRVANIIVGEPFELLPYLSDYEEDRERAVDRVTAIIASRMQSLMDQSDEIQVRKTA